MDRPKVTIYSDGSCIGNPGPGGWAAVLQSGKHEKKISGGFAYTSNNRMELYAAIMALASLKKSCIVDMYTDSRYFCDAIEKGWLNNWKKNGWKKADKKAVLNQDLWQQVDQLLAQHTVEIHWVKAHAGNPLNELVDTLAKEAASKQDLEQDLGYEQSV